MSCNRISGRGTNSKVGEQNVCRVLPLFGSNTSTISRFGERFRDGQCSLVNFLFAVLLLTVAPCPAICKNGGMFPVPYGFGAGDLNIRKFSG